MTCFKKHPRKNCKANHDVLIKMSNYSDSFSGWGWFIFVFSGKPESLKWYEHNGIKQVFISLYNEWKNYNS